MSEVYDREENVKTVREIIKRVDFCMLSTINQNGKIHSRPMSSNGLIDSENDLWFFTHESTAKIFEINSVPYVNVSFADVKNQSYASLSGTATLVKDKNKIKELWKPELKAWFPEGINEPGIALINVDVEHAEYWDSPSSTISHTISYLKSAVTGEKTDIGTHGSVSF